MPRPAEIIVQFLGYFRILFIFIYYAMIRQERERERVRRATNQFGHTVRCPLLTGPSWDSSDSPQFRFVCEYTHSVGTRTRCNAEQQRTETAGLKEEEEKKQKKQQKNCSLI